MENFKGECDKCGVKVKDYWDMPTQMKSCCYEFIQKQKKKEVVDDMIKNKRNVSITNSAEMCIAYLKQIIQGIEESYYEPKLLEQEFDFEKSTNKIFVELKKI